jgi:NADPH:quinone reductase-like Zn-dependent oxidoreductase
VGACLGIPAMTAHRCVFADGPVAGQTVLVTGGGGRFGYYALQWAKQAGARVIATAGNVSGEKACYQAGADYVVNHHTDSIFRRVENAPDHGQINCPIVSNVGSIGKLCYIHPRGRESKEIRTQRTRIAVF